MCHLFFLQAVPISLLLFVSNQEFRLLGLSTFSAPNLGAIFLSKNTKEYPNFLC
jgi:hypothetical protein